MKFWKALEVVIAFFFTFSLLLIPLFNFRENSSSVFCPGRSLEKENEKFKEEVKERRVLRRWGSTA